MYRTFSIRTKISVLLLVLVLVIVTMSSSRILFLREKEDTFFDLAESNRATFEAINLMRLTAVDLDRLARQVVSAQDSQALADARSDLSDVMDQSFLALERIGTGPRESPDIEMKLDDLRNRLEAAIDQQSVHVEALRSLDAAKVTLNRILDRFQARLDRMNVEFQIISATGATSDMTQIENLDVDVRLRVLLSALLDRGRVLVSVSGPAQKREIVSAILPLVGSIVRTLNEAGEFQERPEVLSTLKELRRAIGEVDGISQNAERVLEAKGDFEIASERLTRALAATTDTLSDLAAASEAEIASVYDQTRIASRQAIWNELLLSWGVGLGLIVAVWLVFLQQVSRRIEVLSDEVLRIADGDVETPSRIFGKDEIGRMGEALNTFRRNAQELVRSNEELRNFAYVASHDLRSPLRAIRDLVDWTIEDCEGQLDANGTENLTLIRDRADRLSRLLSDLLEYARADLNETAPEPIDLGSLTRDVAELADPESRFSVVFQGDARAATYLTPLRTILLNLVSNAIKHHDGRTGRVVISSRVSAGYLAIDVIDDGPGIEPRHQEKVFEIFQTLRTSDEIDGSGMGLALVRKLVLALGGKIVLSSAPDENRGSTFTVIIPIGADIGPRAKGDSNPERGEAA